MYSQYIIYVLKKYINNYMRTFIKLILNIILYFSDFSYNFHSRRLVNALENCIPNNKNDQCHGLVILIIQASFMRWGLVEVHLHHEDKHSLLRYSPHNWWELWCTFEEKHLPPSLESEESQVVWCLCEVWEICLDMSYAHLWSRWREWKRSFQLSADSSS